MIRFWKEGLDRGVGTAVFGEGPTEAVEMKAGDGQVVLIEEPGMVCFNL